MATFEKDVIDKVSGLLRGELSAVETYRLALTKLGASSLQPELIKCQQSHEQRVETLRQWIIENGGQPPAGSGLWGAFAKLVEGGARLFGEKTALAALEEGEDKGLRDYHSAFEKVSGEARDLIEKLRSEQQMTHDTLAGLKTHV